MTYRGRTEDGNLCCYRCETEEGGLHSLHMEDCHTGWRTEWICLDCLINANAAAWQTEEILEGDKGKLPRRHWARAGQ